MITGAVICEYNPFHNGHKYMLDMMRLDGCDYIVAVMSGSFTQRGDVAVYSKFERTEAALCAGADLVIELPCVWAVSSAQRFAKGGCDIIKALGCVDRVYFGSESGDIELLKSAANATEDKDVNSLIAQYMKEGDYYPVATEKAVRNLCGNKLADTLTSPNNTLGIEYIKALAASHIEIRTIKRTGVDHDSAETTENIASASKIRELINKGTDHSDFVPHKNKNANPAFYENGERAILCKLRSMSAEEFENLPDVTEGLHNRILTCAKSFSNTEEILAQIKTKRYTHSRLRRIITCAMLGITKDHSSGNVPYVRILGFSQRGAHLVKDINSKSTLPVIANVARDCKVLDEKAKGIFDIDIKATDLRTVFEDSPTPCGRDFTQGIIKV